MVGVIGVVDMRMYVGAYVGVWVCGCAWECMWEVCSVVWAPAVVDSVEGG
jgi:hypothetical protein